MPQKIIALTFDDGPHPETTLPLLDILAENRVCASFFVIGENLTPETVPVTRRAFDMGCEICSHSLTHSDMTAFTPAQIRQEMDETARRIARVTGQPPRFFRPPYIAVNETMWQTIPLPFIAGYGVRDFDDAVSEDARVAGVLQKARDGAVILLHDAEENFKTVGAVRRLIPLLRAEGYAFVTVSQLFASRGIQPAHRILYSHAAQTTLYAEDADE